MEGSNIDERGIYETFGPRLARLRQERGLSQRALAEELSVTRQAVSGWERGQALPDLGVLERLCQVLEVDWNRLCGGEEAPRHRPGRRTAFFAAAVGLTLVLSLAALVPPKLSARRSPPAEEPARAAQVLRGEVLRSHQVTVMAAGPHGLQKKAAGDLAQTLEALEAETEPGAVEITRELREGFSLFGEACQLRFLPAYASGVFESRNDVLTWLYRGLSRKGVPTREQVDGWLDAWFDSSCRWEHDSTENYRLTEDGVYLPESASSGGCVYTLEALERLETGGFFACLRLAETSGVGEALPERLLNLELTAEAGQITFSSVVWEDAQTA